MLDVLEKCLIRNHDGGVKSFLDLDSSYCFKEQPKAKERGFEEGTVVGLDKINHETYRVSFLLKTGFIQLVKEVPSRLPFLIPDKGWAVCTPTKVHSRVSRLQVRDKVYFRVDGDLPASRGSLQQRLSSAIYNDQDFAPNNCLFPDIPALNRDENPSTTSASSTTSPYSNPSATTDPYSNAPSTTHPYTSSTASTTTANYDSTFTNAPYSTATSSTSTETGTSTSSNTQRDTRDRKQMKEKLMSHIVSSTVKSTPEKKEDLAMTSKMKRSIPGDFRSSVEAGRTGKHGLRDPDCISICSNMSITSEHPPVSQCPNVTISNPPPAPLRSSNLPLSSCNTPLHPSNPTLHPSNYPLQTGECDVTSTFHTPVRGTAAPFPTQIPEWYLTAMRSHLAALENTPTLDRTPTQADYSRFHHEPSLFDLAEYSRTHPESSLLDLAEYSKAHLERDLAGQQTPTNPGDRSELVRTPVNILHTPVRRRIIAAPAPSNTVKITRTVNIPLADLDQQEEEEGGQEQGALSVGESSESINVTDD